MSDARLPVAARLSRLGTESAFDVLVRAQALEATGKHVVHLEIGEPDFPTPPHIVEEATKAMRDGFTHYGPPAGLKVLREAIAEEVSRTRFIDVSPRQVVVTPGAKPIIFFSLLALVEAGNEVILPDPGFPIYESLVNFVKAKPVPLPLREAQGFSFTADDLAERLSPRTRLVILNSPHNPCGGALAKKTLEDVADLVRDKPIWVLSDEIYSRMTYGAEHVSLASMPGMTEHTIILDGFSKTYAMTGWRLGYGVFPGMLAEHIARLMTNSNSCTATFTQLAGLAALRGPQDCVAAMMAEFTRRRALVVEGLNRLPGWRCSWPEGAFYTFPNIEGLESASHELASYFLEVAGVALLNGASFGKCGEGHLRLSYANSVENLQEALHRLSTATERWLDEHSHARTAG